MLRFRKCYLLLLLIAPVSGFAANTCIAVNNGWPNGGFTLIAPGFALPAKGLCAHWSGWTKAASTIVMATTGSGCLSSDGKEYEFNLLSVNPNWVTGPVQSDYIRICPNGSTTCPFSSRDVNVGPAKFVTCTSAMLNLPSTHD